MSQGATVFLIDLGRGASGMQKALLAMGFQAGAGTQAQLAEVLGQAVPQVIVAPLESHQAIASSLAQVDGAESVLVFLLSKEADAPMSRVPKGVAAVVPEDIDPGVLGLRIKAAAQTSIFPRQHQATLVGLPAGAIPRAPQVPQVLAAPPPSASAAAPQRAAPSVPPPAPGPVAVPEQRAPSIPPPLPTSAHAPAVVSSAPPLTEALSASKIAVPSNPSSSSAAASSPASALPSAAAPDSEQAVASASPVALSIPSAGAANAASESNGSKRGPLLIAAAVALLAGGGAFLVLGEKTEQALSSDASAPAGDKSAAVAPTLSDEAQAKGNSKADAAPGISAAAAEKVTGEPEAEGEAEAEGAAKSNGTAVEAGEAEAKPSETAGEAKLDAESAQGAEPAVAADSGVLASLFTITETSKLESCEELLGKTEADFAQTVKWKSAHNWKLARKSLMAGKTQEAAKRMCESAFIDSTGPAVAGLVNYYLSERALDQAYAWAKKGVEASPKSRSAKEALGDVLNQMGRVDEAKQVWLESFGLEDESDKRLAGVVRNYVRSAAAARRGGAVPLAERLLRRALSFDEKNKGAAMQLAGVLRKNAQSDLAQRWDEYAASL